MMLKLIASQSKLFFEHVHYNIEAYAVFRGFQGKLSKDIEIHTVRKDRKPVGTPLSIHNTANDFFTKEFGVPVRSQALFASGCRMQADEYGTPYCIIPKGKFSFYWSPKVYDFTVTMDTIFEESEEYRRHQEKIAQLQAQGMYGQDAKLYRHSSNVWGERNKDLIMSRLKDLGYRDTNLEQAIESGNEIAFVCDEVFVLEQETLNEYADVIRILNKK